MAKTTAAERKAREAAEIAATRDAIRASLLQMGPKYVATMDAINALKARTGKEYGAASAQGMTRLSLTETIGRKTVTRFITAPMSGPDFLAFVSAYKVTPDALPTAAEISLKFSEIVREEFTAKELREIIKRNKTNSADACATHDFCDANELMLEAFESFGLDYDEHHDLWSEAWAMSKGNEFAI